MTEAEKAYQYFVVAVPENEEQAKAYFWARKALQPTLTPPNETPPCYQPDGDGCAYQCYDGDDEPIDKCKECPLCYSDKQRHHAPPNEPLTLEQLREMDGEPVYCINIDDYSTKEWMIVGKDDCEGRRYIFDFSTYSRSWLAYRRPPEGEANA